MNDDIATTLHGFLLSRQWQDQPDGVALRFWFATDLGPALVEINEQRSVFFLPQKDLPDVRALVTNLFGAEIGTVALKDFSMDPVVALYFKSHRQARRCADALLERGIEPLEADVNPADRFLMERFVTGGAAAST